MLSIEVAPVGVLSVRGCARSNQRGSWEKDDEEMSDIRGRDPRSDWAKVTLKGVSRKQALNNIDEQNFIGTAPVSSGY